jgi:diguanylate cyclase (GGDEF)-like protein
MRGRKFVMFMLQTILRKVLQKIDIHSTSESKEQGVFFVVLNEQPIFWKSFGPQSNSEPSYQTSIVDWLYDSHPQVTKISFFTPSKIEVNSEIHLGVHRTISQINQEKITRVREADNAFLHGLKQGILFSLYTELENRKNIALFELTKKIHSSIEVDQVLQVIHHSIQELYPEYEAHIWLSHDYNSSLPVKKLNFRGEESDPNCEAFINGKTISYEHQQLMAISSPMRGNQGSYGVLQLIHTIPKENVKQEAEYISILADTVGTALENANLYQQSQSLINQLQLINEASEQLSKTLNLEQNIDFMLSKIIETFTPEGIHFLSYSKGQNEYHMAQTSIPHLQDKTFEINKHPFLKQTHESKESFIASDVESQDCGIFGDICDLSYRSLLIVPMMHNQQMEGMIILTHSKPHHFSYDNLRLLQTLLHHASFAFVNSSLHQEVNRMVITDNLTKLYARNYLDQELPISQSRDLCGSFILIDIDDFKAVNDTYGHQVGDDVLIQVSNVMKSSIRDTDIAARWGGEELAIYLPNVSLEKTVDIAGRIRERVSRETSPRVTISCGISYWEQQDEVKSMTHLFQKADQLLYKAKGAGKNKVIFYEK